MTQSDLKDAEKWGIKNPKDVDASYQSGSEDDPLSAKALSFGGVYGQIDDPEKVVDAMFAYLKTQSQKEQSSDDSTGELVGSPKAVTPEGLDGAVMKCQNVKIKDNDPSATAKGPKEINVPVCIWGDHSTVAFTTAVDVAGALTGKGTDLDEAASIAAKLRNDVRVKL